MLISNSLLTSRLLVSSLISKPYLLGSAAAIIGGGAVTGIVVSEIQNGAQLSSKLKTFVETIGGYLTPLSSGNHSSGQNYLATFFSSILPQLFKTLSSLFQSLGSSLESTTTWTIEQFKSIKENLDSLAKIQSEFQALNHFFGDSQEAKNLLRDLPEKLPNLIRFFSDSSKRDPLLKLFKSEQLEKTKKTLKILMDKEQSTSSVIKAERGLALTLFNEFAKEPEKITKKLDRLVKLVDKVVKTNVSDSGESGSTSGDSNTPYSLTKEKLRSFMQERNDSSQDGFEIGLLLEIGAQSQGVTLPSITANLFSILGTVFKSSPTSSGK